MAEESGATGHVQVDAVKRGTEKVPFRRLLKSRRPSYKTVTPGINCEVKPGIFLRKPRALATRNCVKYSRPQELSYAPVVRLVSSPCHSDHVKMSTVTIRPPDTSYVTLLAGYHVDFPVRPLQEPFSVDFSQ